MTALAELMDRVFRRGQTPAEAYDQCPRLRSVGAGAFEPHRVYGRSPRFFQQLEHADLATAWSQVATRVVAYHGDLDRVCGAEESAEIARLAASGGNPAHHVELPGLDHLWREHDPPRSPRSPRPAHEGDASRRLLDETLAWFDRVLGLGR